MIYNPDEVKLHQEEFGGIRSWWASVPGHPLRQVGHVDTVSRENAINYAMRAAENADAWQVIENTLRENYPNFQIYQGLANTPDINWPVNMDPWQEYMYILKPRRKNGKYQIECALTIK